MGAGQEVGDSLDLGYWSRTLFRNPCRENGSHVKAARIQHPNVSTKRGFSQGRSLIASAYPGFRKKDVMVFNAGRKSLKLFLRDHDEPGNRDKAFHRPP